MTVTRDKARTLKAVFAADGDGVEKTYVGDKGGDWNTPANWDPVGVPGPDDAVKFYSGTVVGSDIVARSVTMNGGSLTLTGGGHVIVGDFTATGAAKLYVTAAESDQPIGVGLFNDATPFYVGGTMTVSGTAVVYPENDVKSGAAVFFNVGTFLLGEEASFNATYLGWGWHPYTEIGKPDVRATYLDYKSTFGVGYTLAPSAGSSHTLGPGYGGDAYKPGTRGKAYGLANAPYLPGGPSSLYQSPPARGGGTIFVRARSLATVNGHLVSDGNSDPAGYTGNYSGSAGGGIWVIGKNLIVGETAAISAKGVGHNWNTYGPGGGRVCLASGLSSEEIVALASGELPEAIQVAEPDDGLCDVSGGFASGGNHGSAGTAVRLYGSHSDVQVEVVGTPETTADSDPVGVNLFEGGSEQLFYAAADHGVYGVSADGLRRYTCAGYVVSNLTDEVQRGTESSFSLTLPNAQLTLTWIWTDLTYGTIVTPGEGGKVSYGGVVRDCAFTAWQPNGTTVELTAVPDEGKEFICWSGDVPASDLYSPTVVFADAVSRRVKPMFGDKQQGLESKRFTGANGSDWYDPANWEPAGLPDANCDLTVEGVAVTMTNATSVSLAKLTVGAGATLRIVAAPSKVTDSACLYTNAAIVAVSGMLKVEAGGTLVPECDIATGAPVVFKVGSFILEKGGKVDATGKGYGWTQYTGTAPEGAKTVSKGGNFYTFAPGAALTYGSASSNTYIDRYAPFAPGSPQHVQDGATGRGGGVVCIHAATVMMLSGEVRATASDNAAAAAFSSSTGGGVWLSGAAVTVADSAKIAARASSLNGGTGAGAPGGKVSICVGLSEDDLATLASGKLPAKVTATDDIPGVWVNVDAGYGTKTVADGRRSAPGTKSLLTWGGSSLLVLDPEDIPAPVAAAVGDGTVTPEQIDDDTYAFTATAASGARFVGWTGDVTGHLVTVPTVEVVRDRVRTLKALFAPEEPTGAKAFVGTVDGEWGNPANWEPAGVPGLGDAVTLTDKTVTGADIAVASLTVSGGTLTLTGGANVIVGDATVTDGAKLNVTAAETDAPMGVQLFDEASRFFVGGKMTVSGGAKVRPENAVVSGAAVSFDVGSLEVAAGASFDATERGWGWRRWDEIGDVDPRAIYLDYCGGIAYYSLAPSCGSGYDVVAGYGGEAKTTSGRRGKTYGYAFAPYLPGSPASLHYVPYSRGGGTVLIRAKGTVTLDGSLVADGDATVSASYTCSCGGGIWVIAKGFKPGAAAFLSAKGVGHRYAKLGPGGGRVCVSTGLSDEEIEAFARGEIPDNVTTGELTSVAFNVDGGEGEAVSGDYSINKGHPGTAMSVSGTHGDTAVQVVGNPVTTGDSDPVGSDSYEQGRTVTFYAAADHGDHGVTADGASRYRCVGYVVSNATEEVSCGTETSVAITIGPQPLKLIWLWTDEERGVSVDPGEGGSVTVGGVTYDEKATFWFSAASAQPIEAVPDDGQEFLYWIGDIQYGKAFENPLMLTEVKTRKLKPVFRTAEAPTTRRWNSGANDWLNPSCWTPNGIPGLADTVVIPQGTVKCTNTVAAGSIAVSNNATLNVSSPASEVIHVKVAGDVRLTDTAKFSIGTSYQRANGLVEIGGDLRLEKCGWNYSTSKPAGGTLTFVPGPLNRGFTHASGAGLVTVGGTCHVASNCWIVVESDKYDGGSALWRVGKLQLDPDGGFDANEKGYSLDETLSPATLAPGLGGSLNCGGGYGGRGTREEAGCGLVYGQELAPVEPGSPSGFWNGGYYINGGGLVRIIARRMDIDGVIKAVGGTWYNGASGGGIWLAAQRFAFGPHALLDAHGGGQDYGGGGGGRIALTEKATEAQLDELARTGAVQLERFMTKLDEAAFEAKWGADIVNVMGGIQGKTNRAGTGTFVFLHAKVGGMTILVR